MIKKWGLEWWFCDKSLLYEGGGGGQIPEVVKNGMAVVQKHVVFHPYLRTQKKAFWASEMSLDLPLSSTPACPLTEITCFFFLTLKGFLYL